MKHPILLSYFRKYMDFKTKIFISLIDLKDMIISYKKKQIRILLTANMQAEPVIPFIDDRKAE